MITASKEQQGLLLKLSDFDSQISRTTSALKSSQSNSTIDELRTESLSLSESLLTANSELERLQDDLAKVLADIDLVDARIRQDEAKAKSVSTDRELKAVETELSSLANRKSILEDSELNLLEEIEKAENLVSEITQNRSSLSDHLERELSKLQGVSQNLSAQISELSAKRAALVQELQVPLMDAYSRKALRGMPVGQTLGRDCSACRLAINGVEFDAMMALPEDSLPTCPNCDAFIIR